jgi:hypothetical protein
VCGVVEGGPIDSQDHSSWRQIVDIGKEIVFFWPGGVFGYSIIFGTDMIEDYDFSNFNYEISEDGAEVAVPKRKTSLTPTTIDYSDHPSLYLHCTWDTGVRLVKIEGKRNRYYCPKCCLTFSKKKKK